MTGTAIALTIAGSDSGGGAGIQADLKTFSALGVYGSSAITAVTAQNTCAVTAIHPIPPEAIAAQIDAVLDDMDVGAVKTGMLGGAEAIAAVTDRLAARRLAPVVDPVMVAKSGDALLAESAIETMIARLLPLAGLLTPNLPEAARLLATAPARDAQAMAEQSRALLGLGPAAVLMKGGHGAGPVCVDLLVTPDGAVRLDAPRIATGNTHGTGCSLSAAIAAGLARGRALEDAVRAAHGWLQGAIRAADRLGVGQGRGPVHHFHEVWR